MQILAGVAYNLSYPYKVCYTELFGITPRRGQKAEWFGLRSDDVLQNMGISVSPTVTLNTQDRNYTYLCVDYPYENMPLDSENGKPVIKMLVCHNEDA